MSLEQLAILGLSLGFSVLGWFARQLWDATQQLRRDLSALEVKISTDFVRYDRLHEVVQPIMVQLNRIEDALRQKVDR